MRCVKCDGCGMELGNEDGVTLVYATGHRHEMPLHKDYCADCWAAFQEWISGEAVRRQMRKVS